MQFNGMNRAPKPLSILRPQNRDIFDQVAENDVFSRVQDEDEATDKVAQNVADIVGQLDLRSDTGESDKKVKAAFENLVKELKTREKNRETESLKQEMRDFVMTQIAKIKPVQNVIEKQLETIIKHVEVPIDIPPPPPQQTIIKEQPKIIKETRVELPAGKYVEMSVVEELKKEIEALKKDLKETTRKADNPIIIPGGSGVIGIPPPEASTVNYVLTVDSDKKAKWKPGTGGGGGVSLSGYTVNNGSSLKTFDVTDTSLDEIARVLGQVITDLSA